MTPPDQTAPIPVPEDNSTPDLPGEPAPVRLPEPVGQQAPVDGDESARREDAVRRVVNDPRT